MEIAIISGKGGTGKSSISAAFASMHQNTMLVDCDVDAANMHILFEPDIHTEEVYIGAETAVIDYNRCVGCGICSTYCRFDAISFIEDGIRINDVFCDGCRLCSRVCPENAIEMIESDKSRLFTGSYRFGSMTFGVLGPGEENSGKLVNLVRDKAKTIAEEKDISTIIIDGPPGIGCPVISTIAGVNHVLVVTEPTKSGMHDLERTLQMTQGFNLKTWVLINKYDINESISKEIELFCASNDISILTRVPFEEDFVKAMMNGVNIIEYSPESKISKDLRLVYDKLLNESST